MDELKFVEELAKFEQKIDEELAVEEFLGNNVVPAAGNIPYNGDVQLAIRTLMQRGATPEHIRAAIRNIHERQALQIAAAPEEEAEETKEEGEMEETKEETKEDSPTDAPADAPTTTEMFGYFIDDIEDQVEQMRHNIENNIMGIDDFDSGRAMRQFVASLAPLYALADRVPYYTAGIVSYVPATDTDNMDEE